MVLWWWSVLGCCRDGCEGPEAAPAEDAGDDEEEPRPDRRDLPQSRSEEETGGEGTCCRAEEVRALVPPESATRVPTGDLGDETFEQGDEQREAQGGEDPEHREGHRAGSGDQCRGEHGGAAETDEQDPVRRHPADTSVQRLRGDAEHDRPGQIDERDRPEVEAELPDEVEDEEEGDDAFGEGDDAGEDEDSA
ncbi:Uncharacterised protein [Brevibacterium casei]|uniref:Uncharacterized protein n=1 Tax=Brevibacterium casei TaxID=33889 RepID=A0A449DA24_9MICO|nr:Uncharacterised protein [Brevibacterium casei]